MIFVVFDIETTGLKPEESEIIEIGGYKVRDGVIVDPFSELIKPTTPISSFITNLTGITNEAVENAFSEQIILEKFLLFVKDADVLMGHNLDRFDYPFINARLTSNGLPIIKKRTLDTLKLAQERVSFKKIKDYKLGTLATFFNITNEDAHRATSDALTVWKIYQQLINYQDKIERCPRCNKPLRKMNGKYGLFIGCTGYPNCRFTAK